MGPKYKCLEKISGVADVHSLLRSIGLYHGGQRNGNSILDYCGSCGQNE